MTRAASLPLRVTQLMLGLVLYGAATALLVRAAVGVPSWSVLTEGLERLLPLSFGWLTLATSVVLLALWIPLRQRPGIGTLLNTLVIGPSADASLAVLPEPDAVGARVALFAAGLALLAVATACYLGASFGSGARDGLMVGLHERLGWPIWLARTAVEATVVIAGGLLGGDVGVGTLVAALAIGPLVQPLLRVFSRLPWSPGCAATRQGDPGATGATAG